MPRSEVTFLDALEEINPALKIKLFLKIVIFFISLCNLTCAFVLVHYSNGWTLEGFGFRVSSIDIFILTSIETVLFPVLAYLSVNVTQSLLLNVDVCTHLSNNILKCYRSCKKCNCKRNSQLHNYKTLESRESVGTNNSFSCDYNLLEDGVGARPLLAAVSMVDESTVPPSCTATPRNAESSLEGYEESDARSKEAKKKIDEGVLKTRGTADEMRALWMFALFVFSTIVQVYIGMKCISFSYTNERLQGSMMGLGVLWVNLYTWSLKEYVQRATIDEGEYIPSLHHHKLHLSLSLVGHWCDLCGQPCKGERSLRCKLCDFDLCFVCYSKKDGKTIEGQLRGDKGLRREEVISNSKYFIRSLQLVSAEWRLFTLALVTLFATNCLSLLMPTIQGNILNDVVDNDADNFNKWVKIYLIVSLVSGLFGGIQSLCFNIVGRKLANTIRTKLFSGIIFQDVAFFDGNSSGQLTSRLTNDINFMVYPIQSMLGTLLSNSILLIGGVALCFYTSWRLSMLAFTTIGPIIYVTQLYASWSQTLNRRIYAALAAANGYATEALANIRTVKAFSTESYEEQKYKDANNNALTKGIYDALGGAGMYTINSYLELGTAVLILWYGGLMAMRDEDSMSPGKLITYQLYWNMLNNSYKNLLDIVTSFTRAAGAAQRVFSLMDSLPDIDLNAGKRLQREELQGSIEFKSVEFAYQMRPNSLVLQGVNLVIPAGSTCAFVGKSGGGKSTMVNLIMRFYDPQRGSILVDGIDMRQLCLFDIRRQIGIVQQNTELFGGTIEENITYGLSEGSWSRHDVIEAAKKACAHDFIKEFPEGYLTRVGERGVRISGGQKQRISIARVFLRKPKILLLDEATSALDAESESKVQEALDTLMADYRQNILQESEKRTIILVAHRLSTVMNADQIAVVNDGKIIELGNHDTLFKMNGFYTKLVQRQLKKKESQLSEDDATS